MDTKKKFDLLALQLQATVDFLKWIGSCDSGGIRQMEVPYAGVALSPALSDLFALARDEVGWMLVMRADEGGWLAQLPLHSAYLGYGDGLLLVTESFEVLEQVVPQVAIEIFMPKLELGQLLATQTLLGFGLDVTPAHEGDPAPAVARVNKVIPLYTKARYETQRRETVTGTARLFQR